MGAPLISIKFPAPVWRDVARLLSLCCEEAGANPTKAGFVLETNSRLTNIQISELNNLRTAQIWLTQAVED